MIGRRLGPYEITDKLGEGGMGEVYRATDTKLRREVAIKVLPAAFTEDKERLARFEREAQLLAQLHHPNIASIFGLEESDGTRALVMELVEGPTLAERLDSGALPLHECLSVALQIAQALEEAHEKGIVHRDLKPQNVKASIEGKVKVLDFGLAKAMDPTATASGSQSQIAKSPTLTMGATVQGVILGTAAYMAPEQAAGGVADRRADVWSFGVVLYEMLSGRRLFEGETVSHVLAGVLREEPDFSRLPAETPRAIRELVRRCLRKKSRERLQSIGDARLVLEDVLAGKVVDEPVAAPSIEAVQRARPAWQFALGLAAAAAVGALAALAVVGRSAAPAASAPRTLSALTNPDGMEIFRPALSPDGKLLAMRAQAVEDPSPRIWIRNLETGDLRALAGTESGNRPFWSPDGRAIGYFDGSDRWFKRIDLEGGRPVRLAKVGAGAMCGASWGASEIVFCDPATGLNRVAPSGGEVTALTRPAEGDFHAMPWILKGDRRLLYIAWSRKSESSTIRIRSLDGEDDRELVATDMKPMVSAGRLYYGRGSTLLARGFDEAAGALEPGDAEIVAEGVDGSGGGEFTVAAGLLVFAPEAARQGSRVTVYDREGKTIEQIDADGFLDDMTLSPDGRLAAVMKRSETAGERGDAIDVWRLDLDRKIFDRVTYGESDDDPVFSPDGARIAFAHEGDLFIKPANGSGEPVLVAKKLGDIVTNDWTAEGTIVFTDIADGNEDLFTIGANGGGTEPRRLTKTPFAERNAVVSPDGRWLAYASDESGDMQVYVTAWPSLDGKWRVSNDKAAMPRWRRDGRELFYLSHDQHLMSASVAADGRAPKLGLPRQLFEVHRQVTYLARTTRWAVMPDGDRFLVLEPLVDGGDLRRPLMLKTQLTGPGGHAR